MFRTKLNSLVISLSSPSTSINDNETKEIAIIRNVVKLEDQEAERKILSLKRNEKEYKVGVIELPAFYFDFDAYQKQGSLGVICRCLEYTFLVHIPSEYCDHKVTFTHRKLEKSLY